MRVKARIQWLRSSWVLGARWDRKVLMVGSAPATLCTEVWVYLVPCLPLHVEVIHRVPRGLRL